jgi:hypothetical protein
VNLKDPVCALIVLIQIHAAIEIRYLGGVAVKHQRFHPEEFTDAPSVA